jgi:2-keto-4-pentenoate hydratase
MDKADLLFNAYKSRKEIEPFEVNEKEAEEIFKKFSSRLVEEEGLGGYKISLVTREHLKRFHGKEPMYGILTKPMITSDKEIELWFNHNFAEVEVVFFADSCRNDNFPQCIKETRLGVELPATRFNTWNLNALQLKADDSAAGRLYIGEQVSLPIKGVEMLINDKLIGRGVPNFIYGGPMDMVKWLISKIGEVNGYVSSGVFIGPFEVKKGEKITILGDVNFEIKLV